MSHQLRPAPCATCNGDEWIADVADETQIPCPSCNAGDPPRPPRDFVSLVTAGDPGIALHCPLCGAALWYVRTEGDTHVYSCPRHGVLILPPDGGRIRQVPQ